MIDPQIIGNIISLASAIKNHIETVQANKQQSQRLYQRIETVIEAVRHLEYGKNVDHYFKGLQKLQEVLEGCLQFISQFTEKHWIKKLALAGSYDKTFKELNQQLCESANLLQLGMVSQQIINHRLDQEDQEQDKKEVLSQLDKLCEQQLSHQRELQDIKLNQVQMLRILEVQERSFKLQLQAKFAVVPEPAYPIAKHEVVAYCDLLFNRVIDEGSLGIVYQGSFRQQSAAIKTLKNLNSASIAEFTREVQLMSRLKHPSIVQFYGACFEEGYHSIVMEYMAKGSLLNHLKTDSKNVTAKQQRQWLLEIAAGLQYLHKSNYIHRDLKSANILISQDEHAKLADFGLTKTTANSILSIKKDSEALAWMAPEIINRTGIYTPQSDIYSFGMLMWEIVTKLPPETNEAAFARVKNNQQLAIPNNVPDVYKKIILACWSPDINMRPELTNIIRELENYVPKDEGVATAESLYLQGLEFEKKGDDIQASRCYELSANQGYSRGLCNLGMFALQGRGGLKQDKSRACKLLEQAAGMGLSRAQYNLGIMLAEKVMVLRKTSVGLSTC